MNERDKAILKNKILEFLLMNKSSLWGLDRLEENYGNKAPSKGHFRELLMEMSDTGSRYFDFKWDSVPHPYFKANDFTKEFLDAGGFLNQYESDKEADEEAAQLVLQDERIKNLTEENLKIRNKLTQWKLLTHWIPIIVSLISLVLVLYKHLKPSNDASKEQMKTKIESLEDEVKQLQNGLKQENEKLKDDLEKADMLISIYESEVR